MLGWSRRLRRIGVITARGVLGAVVLTLLFWAALAFPWANSWDVWTALTAIGTIGGTSLALSLAVYAKRKERDATARVVAAWVTDEFEPQPSGDAYIRTVLLHVANEGDQPVFDARVNVHVGAASVPIGPLAAPTPIAVIPPRRELVFDISTALLGHRNTWNPTALIIFTDARGRRWQRDQSGELSDVTHDRSRWSEPSDEHDERQLGDLTTVLNPMAVALAFLLALREEAAGVEEIEAWLSPTAPGWEAADWASLRSELERYQPTSMVEFPAPRIARVKLSGDQDLEGRSVEGEGMALSDVRFLTLTLHPGMGWRVFGIGGEVSPDEIYFAGSLTLNLRNANRGGDDASASPEAGDVNQKCE